MTDSASEARLYALKLLGYRGRSEKEVRERLIRRGFDRETIDRTLRRLKEAGLVDDRALAVNLRRQAFEGKFLGYEGARAFLLGRGLPKAVVDSTVSYDEDAEVCNAVRFLDKRMASMGNYPAEKKKRRLWNMLGRRGYSPGAIREAMRGFNFDEED